MSDNNSSDLKAQDARLDGLFQEALRAHQAGNLEAAEAGYREVLGLNPDHADANHFLGSELINY